MRIACIALTIVFSIGWSASFAHSAEPAATESPAAWSKIQSLFAPPPEFAGKLGSYRSPLIFADGTPVTSADDWPRRREEILRKWHERLGPWTMLLERVPIEKLAEERRENFAQYRVRLNWLPERPTEGYLLLPDGKGPFPAVIVVYYEPETGIGLGKKSLRDFAYQLAKRGFVTLSVGTGGSIYYPNVENAELQPLSAMACAAANCHTALAAWPNVDPARIGIVGHSYGGKWAMFASCLYDKFACAAWSDGGIVFDERRPNVNYWEPWYLGWQRDRTRKPGVPTADNPRTGAYAQLIQDGDDLHELHALMAPRPFLVSGGSEDQPERWLALNHAVAVNKLLGAGNRVAMSNRPMHDPTPESNEQIYLFFEHFLRPPLPSP